MQQQFSHDVFKAEQDLAEEARGGVNMTRVEALRLKMQRWQTTYERQQGAPPSDQDTAASQVYQRFIPNPTSSLTRTLAGTNPSRCTSGWWRSSAMLWTIGRPLRTWSKGPKPRCTSCSRRVPRLRR